MSSDALSQPPGVPSPEEELLYGRGRDGRVFVASQMRDRRGRKVYSEERAALADAIEAVPRLHAWLWERSAPVGEYCALGICVRTAATSECLVLILGRELTPTTEKEFDAARAARTHCFVYQDKRVRPNADVKRLVKEARDTGATTGHFSSAEELARVGVEHLMARAVHTMRLDIIARRGPAPEIEPVEDRSAPWSEAPVPKYVEEKIAFGEAPDKPESFKTVAEIIEEGRKLAASGSRGEAFEELHDLADSLHLHGRSDLALEVIEVLHEVVRPGEMEPADDAWVLNTEALALARLGRTDEAANRWDRMRTIGEGIGDKDLYSTALQNLATRAIDRGDMKEARELADKSIKLKLELQDYRSVLQLANSLALIATDEGAFDEATHHLDLIEKIATELDDFSLLNSGHGNRGGLLVRRGDYAAAEKHYRLALRFARRAGDAVDEVVSMQNLGAVSADQDRLGDAMRWYRKAVRLAETYELPVQAETLHRSLGAVLHQRARHAEAIKEFDAARQIAWELGDRHQWAVSTANLGGVYVLADKAAEAIEPLEQAASTFRELGDLKWEARARSNIAAAKADLGEVGAAADTIEAAVGLLAADDFEGRASLLRQAGESCLSVPSLTPRAADLLRRALDAEAQYLDADEVGWRAAVAGDFLRRAGAEELGLPFFDRAVETLSEGRHLFDAVNDRALALSDLGRQDAAASDLRRAQQLAEALDDPVLRQRALGNLGEVERRRGEPVAAVQLLSDALDQAKALGDDEIIRDAYSNLALALEDDGRRDEARATLSQLDELGRAAANIGWRAEAAGRLGTLALEAGQFGDAIGEFRRALDLFREAGTGDELHTLGGLAVALSGAQQEDGLEDAVQRLADLVQEGRDPRAVIDYLSRAAQIWLSHDGLDEAGSIFGISALVGVIASGPDERPDDSEEGGSARYGPLFHALLLMLAAARHTPGGDAPALYEEFFCYLNECYSGSGEDLRGLVALATEEVDSAVTKQLADWRFGITSANADGTPT